MKLAAKIFFGGFAVLIVASVAVTVRLLHPAPAFDWPSRLPAGYTVARFSPAASRLQLEVDGGIQERDEWILPGKGSAKNAADRIAAHLGPNWKASGGSDCFAVQTDIDTAPEVFVYERPNGQHEVHANGPAIFPGEFERRVAPLLEHVGLLHRREF